MTIDNSDLQRLEAKIEAGVNKVMDRLDEFRRESRIEMEKAIDRVQIQVSSHDNFIHGGADGNGAKTRIKTLEDAHEAGTFWRRLIAGIAVTSIVGTLWQIVSGHTTQPPSSHP